MAATSIAVSAGAEPATSTSADRTRARDANTAERNAADYERAQARQGRADGDGSGAEEGSGEEVGEDAQAPLPIPPPEKRETVNGIDPELLVERPPRWLACDADAPAEAPASLALTIRGGASMGAWEAGAAWALVRVLRAIEDGDLPGWCTLDLRVATGTSAGSINAVQASVDWMRVTPSTVGDNPLINSWMPVDIEQLAPGLVRTVEERDYLSSDGMLTRRAFEPVLTTVLQPFLPDSGPQRERVIALAMAVTRVDAQSQHTLGIETPTQRGVIHVELRGQSNTIIAVQRVVRALGVQLFLPMDLEARVAGEWLAQSSFASMAFPIVFGAVELETFPYPTACPSSMTALCPVQPSRDWYVDGGVFDSAPISAAVALMNDAVEREPERAEREQHFIYIDPGRSRRKEQIDPATLPVVRRPGAFGPMLSFIVGALETSRNYEMNSLFRTYDFDGLGYRRSKAGRQLHVVDRGYDNVGVYLGWFAALFELEFRRYDYFVGIYDSLYFLAHQYCGDAPDSATCRADIIRTLHDVIGLDREAEPEAAGASTVIRALTARELGLATEVAQNEWFQGPTTPDRVQQALVTAFDPTLPVPPPRTGQSLLGGWVEGEGIPFRMQVFRDELARYDVSVGQATHTAFGRAFVEDPQTAVRRLGAALLDRSVNADYQSDMPPIVRDNALRLSRGTLLAVNIERIRTYDGWLWDPSSIPPPDFHAWQLAPYYADLGLLDPLFRIGYRPTYYNGFYGFGFPVRARFALSPLYIDGTVGVAPVIWRVRNSILSEVEFDASWSILSLAKDGRRALRGAVYEVGTYWFENRIRLAVGYGNNTTELDAFGGGLWTLRVGLADLNGLVYHLTRGQ